MKIFRLMCAQLVCFLAASFMCSGSIEYHLSEQEAKNRLKHIHAQLSLLRGSFNQEYPEQLMSVMFITAGDRVLEIGGNIGRNSCIISSLLNNSSNLVVVESDPITASYLLDNRNLNGFSFHVEPSAISQVNLFQKGWNTAPLESAAADWIQVNTITYSQLKDKYMIPFDVLVADCEGALYYILQDDDNVLKEVKMIIVENDYTSRDHYESVCSKFHDHGFQLAYNKAGGWGPCTKEFYQVWKKPDTSLYRR